MSNESKRIRDLAEAMKGIAEAYEEIAFLIDREESGEEIPEEQLEAVLGKVVMLSFKINSIEKSDIINIGNLLGGK